MIADVFLPWRSEADDAAVGPAASIAAALGARLSIAVVLALPPPLHKDGRLLQVHRWTGLYDAMRTTADAHVARLRDALANAEARVDVRRLDAMYHDAPEVAAVHARHADLVLLGAARIPLAEQETWLHALLTAGGRPVLLLAGDPPALPARRAVLGWRPVREASRAMHDMRAVLARDADVDVVSVDERSQDEDAGIDVAAHLARRGHRARIVHAAPAPSVASALLHHAAVVEAPLLVCGGYGRGRLRERLLGGVTRDLLARSRVPVLFSH